ncbi:hypothetical protein KCP69_22720 [Salmonella enterica subsp. enterica]|nr:hypothetical protein KCP69_22720 [Salmonella enterica subsp. enterica]
MMRWPRALASAQSRPGFSTAAPHDRIARCDAVADLLRWRCPSIYQTARRGAGRFCCRGSARVYRATEAAVAVREGMRVGLGRG